MQKFVKRLNYRQLLKVFPSIALALLPVSGNADNYAAQIKSAQLRQTENGCELSAEILYPLSPDSKEALDKGVPLAWNLLININKVGWLFNSKVFEQSLSYVLQFHALLKQYEVKSPQHSQEMFLSLNTALNDMANVHVLLNADAICAPQDTEYELEIKTEFNREILPAPLRPETYINNQWFLSSDWYIWPIPK